MCSCKLILQTGALTICSVAGFFNFNLIIQRPLHFPKQRTINFLHFCVIIIIINFDIFCTAEDMSRRRRINPKNDAIFYIKNEKDKIGFDVKYINSFKGNYQDLYF